MGTRTILSLIEEMRRDTGSAVRATDLPALARSAIQKAVDNASYWDVRESFVTDLTGVATTAPGGSKRFALAGDEIVLLDIPKQTIPRGVTGYACFTLYGPYPRELEHGVGVDGLPALHTSTLCFECAIPVGTKVRVWGQRRVILPADDNTPIGADDHYMGRATKMYFHELCTVQVIAGDPTNHAYRQQQIAKELMGMKRLRQPIGLNLQSFRSDE